MANRRKPADKARSSRLVGMTTAQTAEEVRRLVDTYGISESAAVNALVIAGEEACKQDSGLLARILLGKTQIDPAIITG